MARTTAEIAHLVDSHYNRSFGRPPDAEMREFIRRAAENGLTSVQPSLRRSKFRLYVLRTDLRHFGQYLTFVPP